MGLVKTVKVEHIREGGLTELVGINEEINTNDYSASVGVTLPGPVSGEILAFALYATEDGSGDIQDSAGHLVIFDSDPSISSGATALTAANWLTVIGHVKVETTDYITDAASATGACAYITDTIVPFHNLSTLYFVWLHDDTTDINDAGADDEQLEFNFWYRIEAQA